jgi:thioredoxin reductase/Fe-S-cluster-containing hydrogenase component 2
MEAFALSAFVLVVVIIAMAIVWARRKADEDKGAERLRLAVAEGQQIPTSLHPVIDPVLCVGSFSCTKVCPEGDVIGVVDGVASLIEAEKCIGHARCAVECPVGAIKLVYGTAEVGVDLPRTDEHFESGREGVFIIGELGGMGLIKNCLRQGLAVGSELKKKLGKSMATETFTDVVVVGGGPAGIAAAVACRRQGLDVRVLEQDTLGGCVAHYPRGKVVMSERVEMPGFGPFGRSILSKEELLNDLRELVDQNGVTIEEGQKVVAIEGKPPKLTVTTEQQGVVQCRAVILAVGLRGTPRKLDVPGEDLAKVMYRLIEPEQFNGKRVLIVGGGDSAVEAAIQLAEESTASVTISYRQDRFSRCKQRNRDKIMQLIQDGAIRPLWNTKVVSIDDKNVFLASTTEGEKPQVPIEFLDEKKPEKKKKPDPEITDPLGPRPEELAIRQIPQRQPIATDATKKRRGPGTSITGKKAVRPLGDNHDDPSGAIGFMELPLTETLPERTRTFVFRPNVAKLEKHEKTTSKSLEVKHQAGGIKLRNDAVIASIGGQLPSEFLNRIGVTTKTYRGEEKTGIGAKPTAKGPSKAQVESRQRLRLALLLTIFGASILATLYAMGPDYYRLSADERAQSSLHDALRPAGLWGHGIGVIATLFMLANFLYAVRKRWRRLKGSASIRTWLTWHMFIGIMSPLVIAFHAAFLLNNLLAVWTWVALSVVVGTGVFGRFLFGLVPAQAGKVMQVAELREKVSEMTKVVQLHMEEASDFRRVQGLFDKATEAPRERTVVAAVLRGNEQKKKLERDLNDVKRLFKSERGYTAYRDAVDNVAKARLQIAFYGNLKRIFRGWLVMHVVISIFMVVLIGAHVGVTTYYGFRWIFSESASSSTSAAPTQPAGDFDEDGRLRVVPKKKSGAPRE